MRVKPSKHHWSVGIELGASDGDLQVKARNADQIRSSQFKLAKILVPTDLSDCSKKALTYAVPLAEQHRASISLLFVAHVHCYIHELTSRSDTSNLESQIRENALARLNGLIEEAVQNRVPAEAVLRLGQPYAEIINTAKTKNSDLIVISTRGGSAIKHDIMGSTAERVVRYAPCPVLIVREDEREFLEEMDNTASQDKAGT